MEQQLSIKYHLKPILVLVPEFSYDTQRAQTLIRMAALLSVKPR